MSSVGGAVDMARLRVVCDSGRGALALADESLRLEAGAGVSPMAGSFSIRAISGVWRERRVALDGDA
jgi:hypothetical protein